MPVYAFVLTPPLKHGSYPHLTSRDIVVWERFLDQFGPSLLGVAYDVAVGGMLPPEGMGEERTRQAWRYSTAIKIDAVVLTEDLALVCEVKPRASLSAVGQALGAAELLELDNPTEKDLVPAVITDASSPDIRYVCEQLGVQLYEVGYPDPVITPLAGVP